MRRSARPAIQAREHRCRAGPEFHDERGDAHATTLVECPAGSTDMRRTVGSIRGCEKMADGRSCERRCSNSTTPRGQSAAQTGRMRGSPRAAMRAPPSPLRFELDDCADWCVVVASSDFDHAGVQRVGIGIGWPLGFRAHCWGTFPAKTECDNLVRSGDLLEIVPLAPRGLAFGGQLVKQIAALYWLVVVHVAWYRDGKSPENLDSVGCLSRRFENNPVDPAVDGD